MKLLLLLGSLAGLAGAQDFTQRGYIEFRGLAFPWTVPGDSSHGIGEAILRWEAGYKLSDSLRLNGMIDSRTDTHQQVERSLRFDWQDRSLRRPALSLRRLSAQYSKSGLTIELGKQFIRWGKADILNPTDRFAPKDFLEVINYDYLGVLAARATYERGAHTFDLVYTPRMTPSRIPLFNQRWAGTAPVEATGYQITDRGPWYPGGGQVGLRWNVLAPGFEFSTSFFEGYNHLPNLDLRLVGQGTGTGLSIPIPVELRRVYPRLRMYGADLAVPLRWFTLKSEAALFTTTSRNADEYLLYVLQLERQQGEWSFVGGYAGEWVTHRFNPFFFSPDRGIAKTFLGRVAYSIDARRSIAFETAIRQSGKGGYFKGEYSQLFGKHWRATAGLVALAGNRQDFLGQYQLNSHVLLTLRYSF